MRRATTTWAVFGTCVTLGVGVLAWLSHSMLSLERAEAEARARLEHELAVGDVLWRMDAWLAPILAQEANRPVEDYRSFNPVAESYTNLLGKIEPGDVLVPSPLLSYRSDLFPLHFEVESDGSVSSPQVPSGNELDVAQSRAPGLELDEQQKLLTRLAASVDVPVLLDRCVAVPEPVVSQELRSNFAQRAQSTVAARQQVLWINEPVAGSVSARSSGQLVPIWVDDDAGALLLFVRRAVVDGADAIQGFVADWAALRAALLAEVEDSEVALGARLERADVNLAALRPRLLTTVPAVLETAHPVASASIWTPACGLLALAWIAFGAFAATVGFSLRQAIAFGDRRARFASAVAHELRTPLTTFRMYSELLATGVIRDEEKRRDYLATLQSESDRLARLVENVLGYARIEDGRFTAHREGITMSDLVARNREVLERRALESSRELVVDVQGSDAPVSVDVDAVGQILFNLVDNACKYGSGAIELSALRESNQAEIAIRDHGAGIARGDRARVFAAFDRGSHAGDDSSTPGVGLGLALARGLARDLGGELMLEDAAPGARFVLRLAV